MFKLDNFHIVNFHLALSSHGWAEREPSENLQFKNDKTLRYYLGIFPNMGGGGAFPIPKPQNQKKVPLNHPKITQKTN